MAGTATVYFDDTLVSEGDGFVVENVNDKSGTYKRGSKMGVGFWSRHGTWEFTIPFEGDPDDQWYTRHINRIVAIQTVPVDSMGEREPGVYLYNRDNTTGGNVACTLTKSEGQWVFELEGRTLERIRELFHKIAAGELQPTKSWMTNVRPRIAVRIGLTIEPANWQIALYLHTEGTKNPWSLDHPNKVGAREKNYLEDKMKVWKGCFDSPDIEPSRIVFLAEPFDPNTLAKALADLLEHIKTAFVVDITEVDDPNNLRKRLPGHTREA